MDNSPKDDDGDGGRNNGNLGRSVARLRGEMLHTLKGRKERETFDTVLLRQKLRKLHGDGARATAANFGRIAT